MAKNQPARRVFHVITTEFWRLSRRIEAEDPQDALTTFNVLRQLGALPEPTRTLLGSIPEPEEVLNEKRKRVWHNPPPNDDAERMLFIELFRQMRNFAVENNQDIDLIYFAIRFICGVKRWEVDSILEEVRK